MAMAVAVQRARDGSGPTIIEAQTYRHYGHSRADPAKYRPADEVDGGWPETRSNVARSASQDWASRRR